MENVGNLLALLMWVAVVAVVAVASWKVFVKAGRPGWSALVPFYNVYVMNGMVGWPGWYLVFFFIPLVNLLMMIVLQYKLAKAFHQGVGFTIGLILLPFVFLPILAFGEATYTQPAPTKFL